MCLRTIWLPLRQTLHRYSSYRHGRISTCLCFQQRSRLSLSVPEIIGRRISQPDSTHPCMVITPLLSRHPRFRWSPDQPSHFEASTSQSLQWCERYNYRLHPWVRRSSRRFRAAYLADAASTYRSHCRTLATQADKKIFTFWKRRIKKVARKNWDW